MKSLASLSYEEKMDLFSNLVELYRKTSNLNKYPKDLIIKMLEAGCWGDFCAKSIEEFKESFLSSENKETNFYSLLKFFARENANEINFDLKIQIMLQILKKSEVLEKCNKENHKFKFIYNRKCRYY